MGKSLKKEILKLRSDGKTYDEIKDLLKCAKATISYHCKRHGLNNDNRTYLTATDKVNMNEFYKTHSLDDTAKEFKVGSSTVMRYVDYKQVKLTELELKKRNYKHVKIHRQKLKEKAVLFKGGKCEKCGYNKCIRALEFHHLDPNEKDYTVSGYSVLSWEKLQIELSKCLLLCANCHRETHDELDKRDVSPLADTELKG